MTYTLTAIAYTLWFTGSVMIVVGLYREIPGYSHNANTGKELVL